MDQRSQFDRYRLLAAIDHGQVFLAADTVAAVGRSADQIGPCVTPEARTA